MLVDSSRGNQDAYPEREMNSSWPATEVDAVKASQQDNDNSGRILVVEGKGNYLTLEDGRKILDGCGGAAVAVSISSS